MSTYIYIHVFICILYIVTRLPSSFLRSLGSNIPHGYLRLEPRVVRNTFVPKPTSKFK